MRLVARGILAAVFAAGTIGCGGSKPSSSSAQPGAKPAPADLQLDPRTSGSPKPTGPAAGVAKPSVD